MYIMFRRYTWCSYIDKVEKYRGTLMWVDLERVYTGEIWKISHGDRPKTLKDYLFQLSPQIFPHVQHQEAMLSQGGCRSAMLLMENIMVDLLNGMDVQIREVCLRIKNPRMMLASYQPDNTPVHTSAKHDIFQITLGNKESYAVDLTAAQYGWYGSATTPWHTYETERLDSICEVRTFGDTARELSMEMENTEPSRKMYWGAVEIMKKGFDFFLAKW
ncbi:MAG: hypothetical protein Q9213_002567 [Squamulea squamosa]